MKTTNYFIELIIAGLGTSLWLAGLAIVILGIPKDLFALLSDKDLSYATIIAVVTPFIYVLGIIVDGALDNLFDEIVKVLNPHESNNEPSWILKPVVWVIGGPVLKNIDGSEDHIRTHNLIRLKSETLSDVYDYRRMKIRILRTWAFNGLMLALVCCGYIFRRWLEDCVFSNPWTMLATSLLLLLSSFSAYRIWSKLLVKEDNFLFHSGALINEDIERGARGNDT